MATATVGCSDNKLIGVSAAVRDPKVTHTKDTTNYHHQMEWCNGIAFADLGYGDGYYAAIDNSIGFVHISYNSSAIHII
jgi:hypothetical protein